jgi:hypothetical protein
MDPQRNKLVVAAALTALVLTASYSGGAEARSMRYHLFKLKERVVKMTGANATLNHSWRMKNGVTVRQKNLYIKGKKYSTTRTFVSSKGNTTRVHNSTAGKSIEKTRKLRNGTTARWYKFQSKLSPYGFSQREVKGTKGGLTRETKYNGGTTTKAKRWATPTSILGVNTTRDAQGKLTWIRRLGRPLRANK